MLNERSNYQFFRTKNLERKFSVSCVCGVCERDKRMKNGKKEKKKRRNNNKVGYCQVAFTLNSPFQLPL